jgi:peptidoglycan/LPS O-acetylase OafA/YrhL
MQVIETQKSTRIFGLDVIRAIAIVLVMLSHVNYLLNIGDPIATTLSGVFGYAGVELFFVLSGFLIGNILLKQYYNNQFSLKFVISFLKRRWLRTLPNYYLVLIINIFVATWFNFPTKHWYLMFFFCQNFYQHNIDFFKESWSLSVEEWTYILLPFVLLASVSFVKSLGKKWTFLITIILLIFLAHVLRYIHFLDNHITDMKIWNTNVRSIVLFRFDSIVFGVLLSWIYVFYKEFLYKYNVYLIIIAAHLFMMQFLILNVLKVDIISCPVYFAVFYFSLSSFIFMCTLPFFIFWISCKNIFSYPILFISKTSYAAYLLHYSLILVLLKYYNYYFDLSNTVVIVIYFGLTFGTSYLLYRFFELPIMNLRDKKQENS